MQHMISPYHIIIGVALLIIITSYIRYHALHTREFILRYWIVNLALIVAFIYQMAHLGTEHTSFPRELAVYLITYTGFLIAKKYKEYFNPVKKQRGLLNYGHKGQNPPLISNRQLNKMASIIVILGIVWWLLTIIPLEKIWPEITEYPYTSYLVGEHPYIYILEIITFGLLGMKMAYKKYPHPGFSKEHPLIINGRIYAQNITGVQRYGIEIIQQLDTMVKRGEVILALPQGQLVTQPELKNIKTEVIGKGNGNKWTQIYLPIYAYKKKGTLLTLAGIAPILKPDYMTTHDISFMRYPESYGKTFRLMYKVGYLLTVYRCKRIITISKFSRDELREFYQLDKGRFTIVGNSAEQILRSQQEKEYKNDSKASEKKDHTRDDESLAKWGLKADAPYYLSVGSKNLHKNQIFIKKLAEKYPDKIFVVAGGSSSRSFGKSGNMTGDNPNLILTGYITDEDLKILYRHAYAFIFPSLYEGFGIPPMEAILSGVKRIALSDIPVFREIYQKGCYFFDPTDVDSFDINKLNDAITSEIRKYYMNKYSWNNSAKTILNMIK